MLFSKLIHFLDNKSILDWIISQNSGYYPTKDKKVIGKLDRIFIFEKIKKSYPSHMARANFMVLSTDMEGQLAKLLQCRDNLF